MRVGRLKPPNDGNLIPKVFLLKSRFTHPAVTVTVGRNAARACPTRAWASSVRSPASSTAGAVPAARRTASANVRRTGAGAGVGACAASGAATSQASTATSGRLVFCNAMEIQVDVGVEVLADVEAFGHAGGEGPPDYRSVHERRHGELGGDHDVHLPEFAVLDAPLDHAGHEAVPARHDFFIVEPRERGEG